MGPSKSKVWHGPSSTVEAMQELGLGSVMIFQSGREIEVE